jgi:phosphoglycerate dehydrogenase-like enzyme
MCCSRRTTQHRSGGSALRALRSGRVRRAAVDGYYPQPHQAELQELGDDRFVILQPHTPWGNSRREQERTWQEQLETYRASLAGRHCRDELG